MLTDFDKSISKAVSLSFTAIDDVGGGAETFSDPIQFQFPPKILSDNRSATWKEHELIGSEPVAVIATSSSRDITLSWTYIVEDYTVDGITGGDITSEIWSIAKIKQQINRLRGYFSRIRGASVYLDSAHIENAIVQFRYPWLTGKSAWSCRLKAVNVKHSEALVGADSNNIFPLRSDIAVDLRLWTNGVYEGTDTALKSVQNLPGLKNEPKPADMWY